MNLPDELLREHSARHTQQLRRYVDGSPARLAELVALVAGPPGRLGQLAADVLGWCAEQHPTRLLPHLPRLLPLLRAPGYHPAVRRGVARALQFVPLPEAWQASIFEHCLHLLDRGTEPAAGRVSALSVAARLARPYPELAAELLEVLARRLPQAPASLQGRAARELPALRVAAGLAPA